jgi:hypothetical protein
MASGHHKGTGEKLTLLLGFARISVSIPHTASLLAIGLGFSGAHVTSEDSASEGESQDDGENGNTSFHGFSPSTHNTALIAALAKRTQSCSQKKLGFLRGSTVLSPRLSAAK